MKAHQRAVLERLRVAGLLLGELEELSQPGAVAEDPTVYGSVQLARNYVDLAFAVAVRLCAIDYLQSVGERAQPARRAVGEAAALVLRLDAAELDALRGDAGFVYQDIAELLWQIREVLNGRARKEAA